jgi:hypothetical protein
MNVSMFAGLVMLFLIAVTWWQYALIGVALLVLIKVCSRIS